MIKGGFYYMGTKASEVFDLFMASVSDFKLDDIYADSGEEGLNTALEPWLLFSIADFDEICTQSLNYTTAEDTGWGDGEFDVCLDVKNKVILSLLMLRYWMERQIQDVLQMNNYLQDHDFKRFSEANNLRAKAEYLRQIIERLDSRLVEYGYDNNAWGSWRSQNFS